MPGPTTGLAERLTPRAGELIGYVRAPASLVLAAGGLVSDRGTGIISDNGGGILSNNGGNIISNNGGSVISNNGGGVTANDSTHYGLLGLNQLPLAGATVTLFDATGQSVKGPDGKPLTTFTDSVGQYAFAASLPAHNLIARVTLPRVGDLGRIVTSGAQSAEIDLASTLATTYVLDRYVATQQLDPQLVLDRLPANVEADTVLAAGKAAGGIAPPTSLAKAELVSQVEALRAQNNALDAQLEAVKKLLILAGASNLGDGLLALDHTFKTIRGIFPAPDGGIYLYDLGDAMVWLVDKDGRLRAIAGRAAKGDGSSPELVKALARLSSYYGNNNIWPMSIDAKGRLIFAASGVDNVDPTGMKLARFTPGGTLEDLSQGLPATYMAAASGPDDLIAFSLIRGNLLQTWQVRPGKMAVPLHTFSHGPEDLSLGYRQAVSAPGGGILLWYGFIVEGVHRYDPATGALTAYLNWNGPTVSDLALDALGHVFFQGDSGNVHERSADGTDKDVADLSSFPKASGPWGRTLGENHNILKTDSGIYFAQGDVVQRYKGGKATSVAGHAQSDAAASGEGTGTLHAPTSFTIATDGALLVLDGSELRRFEPGKPSATLVGASNWNEPIVGDFDAFRLDSVRHAPDGGAYVTTSRAKLTTFAAKWTVRHVSAKGDVSTLYTTDANINHALAAPDGGLTFWESYSDPTDILKPAQQQFVHLPPTGPIQVLIPRSTDVVPFTFTYLPTGELLADLTGRGGNFTSKWALVGPDGTLSPFPALGWFPDVADSKGRVYGAVDLRPTLPAQITRKTPGSPEAAYEVIAGKGGRIFAGNGVDDAIGKCSELQFAGNGDLYFLDQENKQIKRIPADLLQ